jgi:glycosyltransferase involved in cell wall biosynthesis
VVTLSYQQGRFLGETIESVLNQQYPNLELIVMDGGSSDESVAILKSYGKRLQFVSKKDKGQTDAINKGFKQATGDILMYINSDDVMLPNTLQTVAEYFQAHPEAEWVTGDYFIIDADGNKIQMFVVTIKRWMRNWLSLPMLSIANPIIQPSTFWRRSLAERIGVFDESLRYCMDYDYWMRAMLVAPPHVLSNHFSLFRIHSLSKGGSQYTKQFTEEYRVMCKYITNPILRLFHWMSTKIIIAIYNVIK